MLDWNAKVQSSQVNSCHRGQVLQETNSAPSTLQAVFLGWVGGEASSCAPSLSPSPPPSLLPSLQARRTNAIFICSSSQSLKLPAGPPGCRSTQQHNALRATGRKQASSGRRLLREADNVENMQRFLRMESPAPDRGLCADPAEVHLFIYTLFLNKKMLLLFISVRQVSWILLCGEAGVRLRGIFCSVAWTDAWCIGGGIKSTTVHPGYLYMFTV